MISAGAVHRFGDNLTTDDIIAGKHKHRTMDLDDLAGHLMENVRPDFPSRVKPGDFIVAGSNFGCGSSREQAPQLLKHVGVTAVVATSFARIFFRNAINIGLLVLTCDTRGIEEGDRLVYDPDGPELRAEESGRTLTPDPLPADIAEIIASGGLLAHVRRRGDL